MPLNHPYRPLAALAMILATALPVPAQNLAGPYLAAREADMHGDFARVVEYGTRALVRDPANTEMMEALLIANIGLGDFDAAAPVARRLLALNPGDQVAGLVLLGDAMKREDWQGVLDAFEAGTSVGGLMDSMLSAWAYLGLGKMSQALEIFEVLADQPGSEAFALFHQALALGLAGDYENAARILSGEDGRLQLNQRGIVTYAQILSQLERNSDAVEMLDKVFGPGMNEDLQALRADLAAGNPVPFDAIATPRDGMAEVFYAIGESLASDADPGVVLLYARMAEHLNPDNAAPVLLSAQLLEMLERYELAVDAYSRIGTESRSYPQAALGRAEALRRWGKTDEAIGELRTLAKAYPDLAPIHVALGDALRFDERYAEATPAYDAAIALYTTANPAQWPVYFARAITLEREDRWPEAEADFRKALELNPEQPSVLNYLGYSFVEMRENMDEALDMIERAVTARPGDGYITDSLGWVYYRLGRYLEAVAQMERAVELMPVDPIINDHLGDTYWAVGRRREAEFQWSRALSFITDDTDPEEVNADRIRRKLEVGLDVVLEEEGAAPLTRSDEDG